MTNIKDTINSLTNLLKLTPASKEQITDAELQLRVSFAEEYKEYLANYGAVLADGIELTGIAKAEYRNVVFVTQRAWDLNDKVPHKLYVIEDTGVDGIIIWQDNNGDIYRTMPNLEPVKIFGSLSEYISNRVK